MQDTPHHAEKSFRDDLAAFYADARKTGLVRRLIELAADEDLGAWREREPRGGRTAGPYSGDLSTDASIPPSTTTRAKVVARRAGVVCGLAALPDLLDVFAPATVATPSVRDGSTIASGDMLATLEGPLDEVLGLERTLLNLVGRLSGVATQTATYVRAMRLATKDSRAKLCDTRKTTPGLRMLEKYAVRCGGGHSHRIGLYDAVLLKDNHLAGVGVGELAAFVSRAAQRAHELAPGHVGFVEVEVDTLEQLDALLTLPKGVVQIVLLDNMAPPMLRDAAARRDAKAPWLELEASGGITLDTIAAVAQTGVDRISVGALTHSAVQLDVGLDIDA